MSNLKLQVGQLIKEARKAKGLTQKELGAKLGVTDVTIRRYELGGQNLTLETIEKLAHSLEIEFGLYIK